MRTKQKPKPSRRPLHGLALGASALLVAACSEAKEGPGEDPDATPVSCPAPGYAAEGAAEVPFTSLEALVVDEAGTPLAEMRAQACGIDLCLFGTTNENGKVFIEKPASLQKPAFKYGDGRTHAKFALPLGAEGAIEVDLGSQTTVSFPAPETSQPMEAGEEITSNEVTLVLPGELNPVEPDPLDFDTPELTGFRAALVPGDAMPAAVDPSLGFEIVAALTPNGTVLCPAAGLRVPNGPGWPAGSAVEFFVHGVEVLEDWAPYGGWAKVSDGAVSEDGATVETAAGGGIPILGVVGVRLAGAE
jgi:hypothetical protein